MAKALPTSRPVHPSEVKKKAKQSTAIPPAVVAPAATSVPVPTATEARYSIFVQFAYDKTPDDGVKGKKFRRARQQLDSIVFTTTFPDITSIEEAAQVLKYLQEKYGQTATILGWKAMGTRASQLQDKDATARVRRAAIQECVDLLEKLALGSDGGVLEPIKKTYATARDVVAALVDKGEKNVEG